MKFYIIGNNETVMGFSLVGIQGQAVSNRDETSKALKDAVGEGNVGIIFVAERFAREIRPEIDSISAKGSFPLIVEIPDRAGPVEDRAKIRDIVQKAVGVNV